MPAATTELRGASQMIGDDLQHLGRFQDLLAQRSQYALPWEISHHYRRIVHTNLKNWTYAPGRHILEVNGKRARIPYLQDGFVAKYTFTPWPQVRQRLGQIGARVPEKDRRRGFGAQHDQRARPDAAERERWRILNTSRIFDLADTRRLISSPTRHRADIVTKPWRPQGPRRGSALGV